VNVLYKSKNAKRLKFKLWVQQKIDIVFSYKY